MVGQRPALVPGGDGDGVAGLGQGEAVGAGAAPVAVVSDDHGESPAVGGAEGRFRHDVTPAPIKQCARRAVESHPGSQSVGSVYIAHADNDAIASAGRESPGVRLARHRDVAVSHFARGQDALGQAGQRPKQQEKESEYSDVKKHARRTVVRPGSGGVLFGAHSGHDLIVGYLTGHSSHRAMRTGRANPAKVFSSAIRKVTEVPVARAVWPAILQPFPACPTPDTGGRGGAGSCA